MTSRSKVVYLDLETAALPNAADFIDMDDIAAPSNWKDADKILAYCTAERQKRIDRAALNFDLARIVYGGLLALGRHEEDDAMTITGAATPDDEMALVEGLIDVLNDPYTIVVGFNLLGYDLPLLDRRALDFGLPPMRRRRQPRYRAIDEGIVDLAELLSEGERERRYVSLEWYCRRYCPDVIARHPDPLPEGGASVAKALEAGREDLVVAHLACDLERTRALHERWLGFVPLPEG
jgi:hypothetical protein